MDLKELQKDPKMMEIMKEIGSIMQMRSKQEQAENVKNFRILNENAVKGQILFTGSSLMEQFPITEIAQNHGIDKIIYNRGIGGYTTDDFIAEIDTVLFDLAPSKLFINIGSRSGTTCCQNPTGSPRRNRLSTTSHRPTSAPACFLPAGPRPG